MAFRAIRYPSHTTTPDLSHLDELQGKGTCCLFLARFPLLPFFNFSRFNLCIARATDSPFQEHSGL